MRLRVFAGVGLFGVLAALAFWLWPRPDLGALAGDPGATPRPARPAPLRAVDQGYRLEGRVVDPAGKPVAGARVTVGVSGPEADIPGCPSPMPLRDCGPTARARLFAALDAPEERLETTSGEDGRFAFEQLGSAAVDLWAEADGFGPAYLPRAFPLGEVTLRLSPSRALSGEIVDEDGGPIDGAEVRVRAPGLPRARTVRSRAGRFLVPEVATGPFTVIARKDGLLPERVVSEDGAPVTLTLARPRVLLVSAHGAEGPIAAQVQVDLGELLTQPTAPGAPARFEGLYPGDCELRASAPGLASLSRTVKIDANPTVVDLGLLAGAPLSVTLVDDRGGPVGEAKVSLWPIGFGPKAATQLDVPAGARASFGVVPRGRYRLVAQAGLSDSAERGVEIADTPVEVELTLSRGVRIEGQVVDSVGRPVPGVMVSASPLGAGHATDAEGHFSVRVPSAGRFQVLAHHSDWGGAEASVDAPATGVLLRLDPHAALEATITSDAGPVAGAVLELTPKHEGPGGERYFTDHGSDAAGHLVLRGVPAGEYFATVSDRRYLPPGTIPVSLVEGQTAQVQFTLSAGVRLSGTVHDDAGTPIPGARIELLGRHPAVEAKSDAEGHFELSPIDPDFDYRLAARAEGFEFLMRAHVHADAALDLTLTRSRVVSGIALDPSRRPIEAIRIGGRRIDAPEGRFETSLDYREGVDQVVIGAAGFESKVVKIGPGRTDLGEVTLAPAPGIGGRVIDGHGSPVEGALVSCDVCLDPAVSAGDGSYRLTASTDATPRSVEAELGGLSASVELPRGASAVPDLVLASRVHLEGTVFGKDGQPTPGALVFALRSRPNGQSIFVTDAQGHFAEDLSPGSYRFRFSEDLENGPTVQARLEGSRQTLDLGWLPGGQAIAFHVATPTLGELWLVPGELTPPSALADFEPPRAFISLFRGKDGTSGPIPPGHYTAFIGEPYGQGLIAGPAPVDVPGPRDVTLPVFAPAANSE